MALAGRPREKLEQATAIYPLLKDDYDNAYVMSALLAYTDLYEESLAWLGMSPGRVSQLRRQYKQLWQAFHGEAVAAPVSY